MTTSSSSGRRAGVPNYKKGIVLNIVNDILPSSSLDWVAVAERYKIAAQETVDREGPDMKRYFIQKLCNNGRKPTGNSGTNDTTRRAQEIYQRILCKENVGIYGDDSDIDSPLDFEEEFPEMGNLEGPESNSDDEHNDEIADQPVNNEPVAEPPQKKRRTEKSKNCRNGISARTSVSKAIKTCVDGLQGSNNTNVLLSLHADDAATKSADDAATKSADDADDDVHDGKSWFITEYYSWYPAANVHHKYTTEQQLIRFMW
eukprot:CAMPEP_0185017820 /NCGR_PEP_ID=MMETSP1103-20130426/703_1 /TAXON_ID=36769 /ORGANISM="Paraphysomonas bandaiensis, Strain Caron Lab Isolate" /LENGTH=258 /DNA_ID=CAMNT_0027547401 /DNA_START=50 /DNA_END=822 /DNA_ORIENTATION=-